MASLEKRRIKGEKASKGGTIAKKMEKRDWLKFEYPEVLFFKKC